MALDNMTSDEMASDTPDSIEHLVVAVPARDEAATVERCLESVAASAAHLLDDSTHGHRIATVTIAVACDTCADDTAALVRHTDLSTWTHGSRRIAAHAMVGSWSSAGGARRAAVRHGLGLLPPGAADDRVWLATTDADSLVPADWLLRQLRYANGGADAVAGIVELIEPDARTAGAFRRIYSIVAGREHTHVHGANLGVRATAYLAADGFPAVTVSEDHALWNRLRRDGRRCVSPLDVVVRTSARRIGRAAGGFADTLAAASGAEHAG